MKAGPLLVERISIMGGLRQSAILMLGTFPSDKPRRYVRFRVSRMSMRSARPQWNVHVEFGRNRRWVVDINSIDNEYREG